MYFGFNQSNKMEHMKLNNNFADEKRLNLTHMDGIMKIRLPTKSFLQLFKYSIFSFLFLCLYGLYSIRQIRYISTTIIPENYQYIKKFDIQYKKDAAANFSYIPTPKDAPIIVEWNRFSLSSTFYSKEYHSKFCFQKCIYTDDRSMIPMADMVTFNFGHHTLKDFLEDRNPNRMNVFVSFENPEHRPLYLKTPVDYFNITATYRIDSDIRLLYDFFEDISDPSEAFTEDEVNEAIAKKEKLAMFLVSHCNTTSKREILGEEMQKTIDITFLGKCNKKLCDKECEQKAIESHYFTLGFENSDCIDYVTEKVYRLRKLIVPIILDRSILRGVHEKLNPFVIAVSDFKSIEELTDYMKFLISNPDEYKKYFGWTKLYKKTQTKLLRDDLACSLCEIAWHKKNGIGKIIPNFHEWWGNHKCRPEFGQRFLNKEPQSPLIYEETLL